MPIHKPKPNTRFLQNLVKETTNHNQALLAREAAESRLRLERLQGKAMPRGLDLRQRQLGQITSAIQSTNRKGWSKNAVSSRNRDGSLIYENRDSRSSHSEHADKDLIGERNSRKSHRKERVSHGRLSRSRSRSPKEDKQSRRGRISRKRSESPQDEDEDSSRYRRRSRVRKRSRSPQRRNKEEPRTRAGLKRNEKAMDHKSREHSPPAHHAKTNTPALMAKNVEYDSDPLEDIIGPLPPPKVIPRGRGTTTSTSGIDSRFSAQYDPAADIVPDLDEEDDWDQALEALRDRQKWQATQSSRLRAAGFTESEIEKWEKSGKEKTSDEFVWAKRGEDREWDRGKEIADTKSVEKATPIVKGRGAVFDIDDIDIIVRKRSPSIDLSYGRLR